MPSSKTCTVANFSPKTASNHNYRGIIMERITDKNLQALCDRINRIKGAPMEPYSKGEDGRYVANVGNYHLSHAYGGVSLECMVNEAGGVSTPFGCGHITKRDLWNRMQAYLLGLEGR